MSRAYVANNSYFEILPQAAGRESALEVWRAVSSKCRDNPFFTDEFIDGKFQTDQAYVTAGWLLGKAERREASRAFSFALGRRFQEISFFYSEFSGSVTANGTPFLHRPRR